MYVLPFPGDLYLSPVHAQVQMRPAFSYLDKSDTRADAKVAAQEQGWTPAR